MSRAFPALVLISIGILAPVAGSCGHAIASPAPIKLNGFAPSNYISLEKSLNSEVCVKGKLVIDSMGVYYPLQPNEKEGVINIGFSRITAEIGRADAVRQGLRSGRVQTICGLLKDATPFKNCRTQDCKWYKLTGAQARGRF